MPRRCRESSFSIGDGPGGRVTFGAGGHDAAAFGTPSGSLPRGEDSFWKLFGFSWIRLWVRCNCVIPLVLVSEYLESMSYAC